MSQQQVEPARILRDDAHYAVISEIEKIAGHDNICPDDDLVKNLGLLDIEIMEIADAVKLRLAIDLPLPLTVNTVAEFVDLCARRLEAKR